MRDNVRRMIRALFLALPLMAQPAVRPVPPPGIAIPEAERVQLEGGLVHLHTAIDRLNGTVAANGQVVNCESESEVGSHFGSDSHAG